MTCEIKFLYCRVYLPDVFQISSVDFFPGGRYQLNSDLFKIHSPYKMDSQFFAQSCQHEEGMVRRKRNVSLFLSVA